MNAYRVTWQVLAGLGDVSVWSAIAMAESNLTGASRTAALGRKPVHQNANQKSEAPRSTRVPART